MWQGQGKDFILRKDPEKGRRKEGGKGKGVGTSPERLLGDQHEVRVPGCSGLA